MATPVSQPHVARQLWGLPARSRASRLAVAPVLALELERKHGLQHITLGTDVDAALAAGHVRRGVFGVICPGAPQMRRWAKTAR
jgi:hypothetical protein